jgi:hypothetical protein
MKRRLALIVPVVAALVVLGALGAALATRPTPSAHARGGGWLPLGPLPPYTDSSNSPGYCAFRIDNNFYQNEVYTRSETQPDGTVVTRVTGSLKLAATNHDTGKTVDYNISGPGAITAYPDQSILIVGEGLGIQFFPPAAQQQFHLPAVAYIKGKYTESLDSQGNVTSFTHDGATISDVCAALS